MFTINIWCYLSLYFKHQNSDHTSGAAVLSVIRLTREIKVRAWLAANTSDSCMSRTKMRILYLPFCQKLFSWQTCQCIHKQANLVVIQNKSNVKLKYINYASGYLQWASCTTLFSILFSLFSGKRVVGIFHDKYGRHISNQITGILNKGTIIKCMHKYINWIHNLLICKKKNRVAVICPENRKVLFYSCFYTHWYHLDLDWYQSVHYSSGTKCIISFSDVVAQYCDKHGDCNTLFKNDLIQCHHNTHCCSIVTIIENSYQN